MNYELRIKEKRNILSLAVRGFFAENYKRQKQGIKKQSRTDQRSYVYLLNKCLKIVNSHCSKISSILIEKYKNNITANKSTVNNIGTLRTAKDSKKNPAATLTKKADKTLSLDFINKLSINKSITYRNLKFQF